MINKLGLRSLMVVFSVLSKVVYVVKLAQHFGK